MARHAAMLLLAGALMLPAVARAQDTPREAAACQPLKQLAGIHMQTDVAGHWLAPVEIDGRQGLMAVDFNTQTTQVTPELVASLNADTARQYKMYLESNDGERNRSSRYAKLGSLKLGQIKFDGANVMVMTPPADDKTRAPEFFGFLGMDLLTAFDIEFDYGANLLNLFNKQHCPGRIANMNPDTTVMVPLARGLFINFWVRLDGMPLVAALFIDSGENFAILGQIKKPPLSFDEKASGVTAMSDAPGRKWKRYSYRFKTLDIGGLTLTNPNFVIVDMPQIDDRPPQRRYWQAEDRSGDWRQPPTTGGRSNEVAFGLATLRKLHFYIASAESKLYISPSEAKTAP